MRLLNWQRTLSLRWPPSSVFSGQRFRHLATRTWGLSTLTLVLIVCPLVASAWFLSSGRSSLGSQDPVREKPNIILIMADDLGYGDISPYGGWIQTPHLERLAREGVRFTDYHASGPVCSPTRAGLLTGRYQQRAGIPGVIYADPENSVHEDGLQEEEVTFAELLKEAGYRTGIFGKWHLGYLPEYNPIHHGFDEFRGYVSGNVDYFSKVDQAGSHDWWHNEQRVEEEGYVTHLINRYAVDFIERHREDPFCLYIAHEAPHYPYQSPQDDSFRVAGQSQVRQELSKAQIQDAYRQMVQEMDQGIGEIITRLDQLGLSDQTFVFFCSDNGATAGGSNGPLRGHKGELWEGGHRVPAIAWWPEHISPGTVSDDPVTSLDLLPTMLELAGLSTPSGHELDGVSLHPLLLGARHPLLRELFWEYRDQQSMRLGTWKLLLNARGLDGPGLFDLHSDLSEQNNLADQYPERVESMRETLERWRREMRETATHQPGDRTGVEDHF